MKRPTKHILIGLLAAAILFVLGCAALKGTLSDSTFQVLNAIWFAVVLVGWLVWSFSRRFQPNRSEL